MGASVSRQDFERWTPGDVAMAIDENLGVAYKLYTKTVVENSVSGEFLVDLNDEQFEETLTDMNIENRLHRRILKKIFHTIVFRDVNDEMNHNDSGIASLPNKAPQLLSRDLASLQHVKQESGVRQDIPIDLVSVTDIKEEDSGSGHQELQEDTEDDKQEAHQVTSRDLSSIKESKEDKSIHQDIPIDTIDLISVMDCNEDKIGSAQQGMQEKDKEDETLKAYKVASTDLFSQKNIDEGSHQNIPIDLISIMDTTEDDASSTSNDLQEKEKKIYEKEVHEANYNNHNINNYEDYLYGYKRGEQTQDGQYQKFNNILSSRNQDDTDLENPDTIDEENEYVVHDKDHNHDKKYGRNEKENKTWLNMYEKLKEYKKIHGSLRVKSNYDKKLQQWVISQRYRLSKRDPSLCQRTKSRIQCLNEIGFRWGNQKGKLCYADIGFQREH